MASGCMDEVVPFHVIGVRCATSEGCAMYETVVYSEAVAIGAYVLARAMPGRRPVPG
jgi:hypothetical protein